MKLKLCTLLCALAICVVSAGVVLAKLPPPYDFTGAWAGTATSQGTAFDLTADFAATSNPRKFTGQSTLAEGGGNHIDCTFTATYKKTLKLHSKCNDRSKSTISARFDTTTQTLAGAFRVGHHHAQRATFTLMRVI